VYDCFRNQFDDDFKMLISLHLDVRIVFEAWIIMKILHETCTIERERERDKVDNDNEGSASINIISHSYFLQSAAIFTIISIFNYCSRALNFVARLN
jgi:hypothetical protein